MGYRLPLDPEQLHLDRAQWLEDQGKMVAEKLE